MGAQMMASIDHLHQESITLKVRDNSDMLSMQYLVNGLGGPRLSWHHNARAKTHEGNSLLYTLPNCSSKIGASKKESIQNHSAPRKQSTGRQPTHNSGRGTETEPETTIRTLPSTAAQQAQGVRRTNRHLYRLELRHRT